MAIVISEKMYMSFQERGTDDDKVLLGFATYLEDNKAFEKRKATVDSWGNTYTYDYIKEDDPRWDPEHPNQRLQSVKVERPDLAATIIDNPLLTGFKIAREVRRHGWGGGNVVWRIEDPRGFELEISSANMASIMDCCTIYRGTIDTPCRWGWNKQNGSRVVLLPEGTEPYKDAVADNELHNTKPLKIADIGIGDIVKLKNGRKGTYMGGHYYIHPQSFPNESEVERKYIDKFEWRSSKKKTHFFYEEETNKIFVVVSPKVARVVQKIKTIIDPQSAANDINTRLRLEERVDSFTSIQHIAVSPQPIKSEDIKGTLVPITADDLSIIEKEDRWKPIELTYEKFPIMFEYVGRLHRHSGAKYMCRDERVTINTVRVNHDNLLEGTYTVAGHMHKPNRGQWYTSRTPHMIEDRTEMAEAVIKECPLSIFMIKYNGKLYSPRIY